MHLALKKPYESRTQFAVCVSLLAVFLIYFAPLLSQLSNTFSSQPVSEIPLTIDTMSSMQAMPAEVRPMSENMSAAGHDHAQMVAREKTSHSNHKGHEGHHAQGESTNVLEACGYCSLLFHLNWIDVKTFELVPLLQSRYPTIVTTTIARKYPALFTSLQPRAPPNKTS